MHIWHTILVATSVLWILASIFLIYTAGRALVFFEWKLLLIGALVWFLATLAQVVTSIIAE